MEQKRIKVRLTKNSPYSDYGYYEKGDIGYIDGYVNDNAVIILENGKFAKADLRWIEVVNEEDKNVNTELKESEDEKIRKALKQYFVNSFQNNGVAAICGVHVKDILAWIEEQEQHKKFRDSIQVGDKVTKNEDGVLVNLSQLKRVAKKDEKQGEHKSAWSEEDEFELECVLGHLRNYLHEDSYIRYENWLKSLKNRVQPKPKQEWSEEDKKKLNLALYFLNESKQNAPEEFETYGKRLSKKDYEDVVNWLKSIRPQNRWKPSEEQMEALESATENCAHSEYQDCLRELIGQLKKLKENNV